MNGQPYIPRRTRLELAHPAPTGQRHAQAVKIASSLAGQGLHEDAIAAQLRTMYADDVSDSELVGIARWSTRRGFTPCAAKVNGPQRKTAPAKTVDPVVAIDRFLDGDTTNEADLWRVSPWRPLEDWRVDPIMLIAGMYHGGEMVNLVTEYILDEKGKAKPAGHGLTLERDAAMRYFRDKGTPQSRAGAWLRMNPVDGKGVADVNVTAYRFALLEIDTVPVEKQISVFAKLPLPINCIMLSGGKSCHAWVRINAPDYASYRATVTEMLDILKPLGIDQTNKNPSRLSRLPGAKREIGAQGGGQQRLLYLAPDRRDSNPIFMVNR